MIQAKQWLKTLTPQKTTDVWNPDNWSLTKIKNGYHLDPFVEGGNIQMALYPPDTVEPVHTVCAVELLYVKDGALCVTVDGTPLKVGEGDLLLLDQRAARQLSKREPGSQVYRLWCALSMFDYKFFNLMTDDNLFCGFIYNAIHMAAPTEGYLLAHGVSRDVEELYLSLQEPGKTPYSRYSCLAVLLLRLYDFQDTVHVPDSGNMAERQYRDSIMDELLEYISGNLRGAALSGASKQVHMHPNYLCKIIKDSTGKTFTEILTEMRMEKAMSKLRLSDASLECIAHEVGFNSPNYFYKVFKDFCGVTPGHYRRQNRKSTELTPPRHDARTLDKKGREQIFESLRPKELNRLRIAFLPAGGYNYILSVGKGLSIGASLYGAVVDSYVPREDNVNDQIKLLLDLMEQDYDAVLVNSHDDNAVAPYLGKLTERGVAVCLVNSDTQTFPTPVHAVIGYRQRYATNEIGRYCVGKMNGCIAKVGIIQGKTGYHSVERCGGFIDAVQQESNFEIISIFNGNWSDQGGYYAAREMLENQPQVNVIFCANDQEASGVVRAIEEMHRSDIMLLGNDGDLEALRYIQSGKITATVGTNAFEMGAEAARVIRGIFTGTFYGGYVETSTQIVDKSNVEVYLRLAESYGELVK